jgi:Flp pilus assembly protein TadD
MRRLWICAIVSAFAFAACRATPAPDDGANKPGAPGGRETSAAGGGTGVVGGLQPADPVTFTKDVAPILYSNCVTCHRPGQVAPFSLITYDDAKRRADAIKDVTGAREMPPWLAAPGDFAFVGDRRLRDEQIATLRRWAESGAPEGDPKQHPAPPAFPEGWQLGRPDLVVTMPRPFVLKAGTGDRYRQIVYPLSLPAGRFVRAVEFRPGAAPVHHAVIRVDQTHTSRRRDAADAEPGFEGLMAGDVRDPDGHFVGWAPGRGPIVAPEGMSWRLDRGTDLVVELHMIPGNTAVNIQPTIGFFFTDEPPKATPVGLTMGVLTIDIPAGEPAYAVKTSYSLPVDVTLLSLSPHAHYLGKEMHVTAALPDGSTKRLLHIPHWDFHWQQEYRFTTPVALPRGTTVSLAYTYDNSGANEHNPSHPPKRVMYGLHSTDEMANLGLQVLTASTGDRRRLMRSVLEMQNRENVAGAEMKARIDPRNPQYQWELGRSLVEAGRLADAIGPLEISVRSDPKFARAHDFLGRALFSARRPDDALAHFRRAVSLDPNDELLHLDLGKVLADLGQLPDAVRSFQRALQVNPEYGPAHEGLGVAYVRLGKFNDAVDAFRRAVALAPDSPSAENGLAVALAQSGRIQEALEHVRRALALDPDFAPALDNLKRMSGGR